MGGGGGREGRLHIQGGSNKAGIFFLDPGPQALAGLRHGVPVEGPHHLLYLLDQILGFVARLCNDPYFRFAPHKIEELQSGELGGQTSSLYTSATVLLWVFPKVLNLYHHIMVHPAQSLETVPASVPSC